MMNKLADNQNGAPLPAHEMAYRNLRDAILFGEMAPGDAVTIQGLIARTGAGMTPVREALRRLTSEGALVMLENRRLQVPKLNDAAASELRDARVALEPILAEKACQNYSKMKICALKEIDAALDDAILRGDTSGYLVHNHRFHTHINETAQSPVISDLVAGLWLRFGPSLRVVCGQFGTRNLPDQHHALIAAFEAKDSTAAHTAMEQDVLQGMELVLQNLG